MAVATLAEQGGARLDDSQLRQRVLAVAVMVPMALLLTWIGDLSFDLMIIFCAGLLAREWARLCGVLPAMPLGWALMASVSAILLGLAGGWMVPGLVVTLLGTAGLAWVAARRVGHTTAIWFGCGLLAIVPAGIAMIWLRSEAEHGFAVVVWLFLVIWATDTAAFFVGRAIGGPLLAPTISPGKTWAGLAGGLLGAAVAGGIAASLLGTTPGGIGMGIGLIVGVAAGLGDLFESHMKRRFSIKDSGGLIPGHGGALDRLDSLLAAAPVAAALYIAGWRWL